MIPPIDSRRVRPKRALKMVATALVAALALISLRVGGKPEAELSADLPGIGPRTVVTALGREPDRGLRRMTLELLQGERVTPLADREFEPRPVWSFWGESTAEAQIAVPVGSTVTEGLVAGEATLRLTLWRAGTWLRTPDPVTHELLLPVRLTPPRLSVLSSQHYPRQGGSETVVYRFGEHVVRHGVEVGERFFPGYPLPGGGGSFTLFAVPYDLASDATIRLVAVDDLGNRAERAFVDLLRPREPRHDMINVGDRFIERVALQIESQTPELTATGSLVERYLAINSGLRASNRKQIADLARDSAREFLWQGAFTPMPNGQVMARFADRRTYFYEGREVDRQDHLGFDLASVKRAKVPAANSGIVVMTRFLGIYGNVVVIDHGYGLMSLYGHLSSFEVATGDRVARGQTLGRTGQTGLAGGDHLHFAVFLHGVATDPVEWLDQDWIDNRVLAKLGIATGSAS
ncbi:MAG: M23 family metallopeptidase [Acidobacteria bacterium]|nr:M23 family metallopeptidase [Acidobacteriota bacterium]